MRLSHSTHVDQECKTRNERKWWKNEHTNPRKLKWFFVSFEMKFSMKRSEKKTHTKKLSSGKKKKKYRWVRNGVCVLYVRLSICNKYHTHLFPFSIKTQNEKERENDRRSRIYHQHVLCVFVSEFEESVSEKKTHNSHPFTSELVLFFFFFFLRFNCNIWFIQCDLYVSKANIPTRDR